jgi:hypothetical protein
MPSNRSLCCLNNLNSHYMSMSYKISTEVHREVDKKGTMVDSRIGEYEPVEDERFGLVMICDSIIGHTHACRMS